MRTPTRPLILFLALTVVVTAALQAPRPVSANEPLLQRPRAAFELAYLGISHREAQVHQSSTARPHHLFEGFLSSLDATCAALHVVADRPSDEDR